MFRIFLVLFFTCFSVTAQQNKLPIPTKAFIEKLKNKDNPEEEYFTKYLGKKSERILKRFNESKDFCAKEFEFKTGIKLKSDSCSETGSDVEIVFSNYAKSEVIKFVEWFFKTNDNIWNKSKTKYQRKEEGDAGCYFEIRESKNKIILSYYCGC
ncbi:hypothetical protein [Flavobacterium panacagri]|uniref:hypothetical protein n=1 Tax=Flavobacterium panacagri TaxID=3034146 RepID=UPI0025A52436|nr:hypothetical protein [Flavobacterium panacagri]